MLRGKLAWAPDSTDPWGAYCSKRADYRRLALCRLDPDHPIVAGFRTLTSQGGSYALQSFLWYPKEIRRIISSLLFSIGYRIMIDLDFYQVPQPSPLQNPKSWVQGLDGRHDTTKPLLRPLRGSAAVNFMALASLTAMFFTMTGIWIITSDVMRIWAAWARLHLGHQYSRFGRAKSSPLSNSIRLPISD